MTRPAASRTRRRRTGLATALVAVVTASLATGAVGAAPSGLRCGSNIGVSALRPEGTATLDWLVVPTDRVLPLARLSVGSFAFATKLLLWVRSGSGGSLLLPAGSAGWTVATVQQPVAAVVLPSCPRGNQWLSYTARVHVHAPGCLPVEVRSGGRRATVRMSIGKPCAK